MMRKQGDLGLESTSLNALSKTWKTVFVLCFLYQLYKITIQQEKVSGQWYGE